MMLAKIVQRERPLFNLQRYMIPLYYRKAGQISFSNTKQQNEIVVKSKLKTIQIPEKSYASYVTQNFEKFGDSPAITCGSTGRSYNYQILYFMVNRLAQALVSSTGCGLKQGDVIGLLLPNIPEFPGIVYAISEAGLKTTFANPMYTPQEVARQFTIADVKLIVTIKLLADLAKVYEKLAKNYRGTIIVGGEYDSKNNHIFDLQTLVLTGHEAKLPSINYADTALVPFSSGTSGLPKGVELTHKNIIANCEQTIDPSMNKVTNPEFKMANVTVLAIPPFFHIYGFNSIMNVNLKIGNHLIILPKFTPEGYVNCLATYRPVVILAVPSLLLFLASHPAVKPEHLASITDVYVGAAPAPEKLLTKFRNKVSGPVNIYQGYGMTEMSPAALLTPLNFNMKKLGTCGILLANTEAKIMCLSDGVSMGPNKPGELYVRGPQVMKGYLNDEKATQKILTHDGWIMTGDVAYYDEDEYFYIIDRTKELIKVKGMQVSPTELENVIMEMPGVVDVAIVGVPDEKAGEVPHAFVVADDKSLSETSVINYVNERVVKYKRIQKVSFVSKIPRNSTGKTIREELIK